MGLKVNKAITYLKNVNLLFLKLIALVLYCVLTHSLSAPVYAEMIQDSTGSHHFEQTPKRVAVLAWELAEQVIELGILPIAMPEVEQYHKWVVKPSLPATVEDLGSRDEPNLEKLMQLKPDLILIGYPQSDIKNQLEKIAPVLYFNSYSKAHNNVEAVIWGFKELAKLFGKQELAVKKLDDMNARIKFLGAELQQAFGVPLPKVTTLRFANTTSVYLFGDNSISQYVLKQMGFAPALPQENSQWGVTQTRLRELRKVGEGVVLYFKPFEQEEKLQNSPLWNAMPFVKVNHINSVASTWTYGGAMSIGYVAESLANSLREVAVKSTKIKSDKIVAMN
ncbi:MAG: ABC-type Fe3+-hydroxamate transport system substrate-binding protein [Pseudohongiellaceae bacterium]